LFLKHKLEPEEQNKENKDQQTVSLNLTTEKEKLELADNNVKPEASELLKNSQASENVTSSTSTSSTSNLVNDPVTETQKVDQVEDSSASTTVRVEPNISKRMSSKLRSHQMNQHHSHHGHDHHHERVADSTTSVSSHQTKVNDETSHNVPNSKDQHQTVSPIPSNDLNETLNKVTGSSLPKEEHITSSTTTNTDTLSAGASSTLAADQQTE
jgi:hypothetical protein